MYRYRRHHRRFRRRFIRRRVPKGTFLRRKRRDPYKKAVKSANHTTRKLKQYNKLKIQRPLMPSCVYRKFTQFTFYDFNQTEFNAAPKGTVTKDYTIGYCIPVQDLTYYKARYLFGNLVSMTVTFYLENTSNLIQVFDLGSATFGQTQVTDTKNFPDMYVASWNSSDEQQEYNIDCSTSSNLQLLLSNKQIGRLNQTNKITRTYHLPQAYRSVYSQTAGWTDATFLDIALAGPVFDEPHGWTFHWPTYATFRASTEVKVRLAIRVDSTFSFRGRKRDT